jgi:outer membrane protein assembly factor BamD
LELIQDLLAAKEMYLARHYMKKQKWIAAINRLKFITNNYDTTIYIEEALHRLVETHYQIGLEEEAQKYAKILGYNYQSSEWYKQSYKVFNKNYSNISKRKKEKDKKKLLDKIKSFF